MLRFLYRDREFHIDLFLCFLNLAFEYVTYYAEVCLNEPCRAGELSNQEIDNLMTIVANPRQFKIPDWFLNRKKDYKDGKFSQVTSNALDMKLRDDLERLKKIR